MHSVWELYFFWSTALFRRFVLLVFVEKRKKKSGGKAPHSKKAKPEWGIAAE